MAEMVDWGRAAGFDIVCAGKGTKYLPAYHASTPETVWGHYGFSEAQVAAGDFNARMFNSFLDGTKSAIEMASVANATGLAPAPGGLRFPGCGVDVVATARGPLAAGEKLDGEGGFPVYGKLMPAAESLARAALRIGLANDVLRLRPIGGGEIVRWSDVAIDETSEPVRVRRD